MEFQDRRIQLPYGEALPHLKASGRNTPGEKITPQPRDEPLRRDSECYVYWLLAGRLRA